MVKCYECENWNFHDAQVREDWDSYGTGVFGFGAKIGICVTRRDCGMPYLTAAHFHCETFSLKMKEPVDKKKFFCNLKEIHKKGAVENV